MSIEPNDLLELFIALLAAFAVSVYALELRDRKKSREEDRNSRDEERGFRKEQSQEEIELRREELEHRRQLWRIEEGKAISELSLISPHIGTMANLLKQSLVEDTKWFTVGLQKSVLFPYKSTIFGARSNHFREEKEQIAEQFCQQLIPYVEERLVRDKFEQIFLIIDSGTTLYPFFSILGRMALRDRLRDVRPQWLDRVEVITNNFPGVLRLIEAGRPESGSNDRTTKMPVTCSIVAGQLLTEYVAITGEDAIASLQKIVEDRRRAYSKCHFISLVTGNWIRLRTTDPVCPVPLARGNGHLEFKQAVMHIADEVCVVSPLGKIFTEESLTFVNDLLELPSRDGTAPAYREINTEDVKFPVDPHKIRLVTSVRTSEESILRGHAVAVATRFGLYALPTIHKFRQSSARLPVFVKYDPASTDSALQKQEEFPHPATRRAAFFRIFHCAG